MRNKTLFLILFVVVVLVLAIVLNKKNINSFFLQKLTYNNNQINTTNNISKLNFTPSLDELNNIESISISHSDWQTYKNSFYGFEIKAPKSWIIESSGKTDFLENVTTSSTSYINYLSFSPVVNDSFYAPLDLTVEDNPNNLSIVDWMLKKDPENHSQWQEGLVKIDIPTTEEAAAFFISMGDNGGIYRYVVKKNNKIYNFNSVDSNPDLRNGDAMMYSIVKTIRFK